MSKRLLYDFICGSGHKNEHLVSPDTVALRCKECGLMASRAVSTPTIKLEGWSHAFPSAAAKWDRQHTEAAKVARQRKDIPPSI